MPVERFGNYDLIERIAVGGMAEVYVARALDPKLTGKPIVVKRMLPQLAESDEHVTMFLDEAKLGALLKHSCIVDVLDVGKVDKSWYMALEYVDGPDLGQVLKTARDAKTPLPNALAAYVIARAAEGLHFAHHIADPKTGTRLGLVHRDVSPQNILVSRDGSVKVADFGVAKSEQQMHHTKTGLVKGKIAYMSPEQISAQTVDARTDVLALGVALWESLTHRRLYGNLSDVEIMKKVYFDVPPPPSTANPKLDPDIDGIVMRAVARRRGERTPSAAVLMTELDLWAARQTPPASKNALATWMQARFVPRATVAEAATAWAFRSPARGSQAEGFVVTETTEVDRMPTILDDQPLDELVGDDGPSPAHDQGPTPTPRKRTITPLKPGLKLKPLGRAKPTSTAQRDLVLYVEDETENWLVAELRLKKNYELLHAADDQMACELLRTRGRDLTAVLMDIQLKGSELDGIALVKLLRGKLAGDKLPSYARGVPLLDCPVFFVTAYAARYNESELLSHGADKLVTKPVDFAQMTLALTSFHLRRAALRDRI